ncbi:Predicted arabinose efflux permease, MFS family [Geosporobacter subterraneus DSM 17957]|uniref:Predicted arabinose efflux permease, MFS family n=1 Tax=Geosporobacter subterraneus DSM 17957 TaxID=1121919 RepID=A0A1M6KBM9_9FIRM|nr:MFS transporter [Geosporobacter subterraneus]SHJ56376.1 Predicted arabinose efflux permease, MFS family [Geosporobacter subterraneus DSM 17957]
MSKKILFFIITGFFWFSLYTYIPQMTNYAKEMGASYKMIGLIAGVYGLSQTILRIPLGIVSDAFNRRKVFVEIGLLITVASALLVFLVPNVYMLLMGRFIAGIAAATWVNFTVMFSGYFDASQSTKAIGIINSASKVGQFTAMLLGGVVSLRFGIRYVFLLSVLGGSIGFILSLFVREKQDPRRRKTFRTADLSSILSDRYILHISLLGIISQLMNYSTTFGFTPLIASGLGADNLDLGLLATAFNLPQIAFAALSGTLFIKYFGEKNTLLLGFSVTTAMCMITPFVPNLPILYFVQVINGIGNAISFPLLMGLVIKNVDTGLRNTTMGVYQAMYGVGMLIGPMLLGSVGDAFGLVSGFIATGLLGVLAMVSIQLFSAKQNMQSNQTL